MTTTDTEVEARALLAKIAETQEWAAEPSVDFRAFWPYEPVTGPLDDLNLAFARAIWELAKKGCVFRHGVWPTGEMWWVYQHSGGFESTGSPDPYIAVFRAVLELSKEEE